MCSCVVDAEIPRKHARALPSSTGHLSPVFCTRSICFKNTKTLFWSLGDWTLINLTSLTTIAKFMSSTICYNEPHGLLLTFWSPDYMQNEELSAHWTYKSWKDTDVLVLTSKFLRQWPYKQHKTDPQDKPCHGAGAGYHSSRVGTEVPLNQHLPIVLSYQSAPGLYPLPSDTADY